MKQNEDWTNEKSIPRDQQIFLISDLNLGDGTRSDSFLSKDEQLISFLQHVREEDGHLVITGDAFDFHQAWSPARMLSAWSVEPTPMERMIKAHPRLIAELNILASEGGGITYIWGNNDQDVSLFQDLLKFDVCSVLWIGSEIRVEHGSQFSPLIAKQNPVSGFMKKLHHLTERLLDTWIRAPLENFYTFENRLAFWVAHKVYRALRTRNKILKSFGRHEKANRSERLMHCWAQDQLGDPANIFEQVRAHLEKAEHSVLITGHSKLPGIVDIPVESEGQTTTKRYINTGSWSFGAAQYAHWDGQGFSLQDWISKEKYSDVGYTELMSRKHLHLTFESWWNENYLGWLQFRCAPPPAESESEHEESQSDLPSAEPVSSIDIVESENTNQ